MPDSGCVEYSGSHDMTILQKISTATSFITLFFTLLLICLFISEQKGVWNQPTTKVEGIRYWYNWYFLFTICGYLLFCLVSSFPFVKLRVLKLGGIVAHAALIPLFKAGVMFMPISCLFLLCPVSWLLMLWERTIMSNEKKCPTIFMEGEREWKEKTGPMDIRNHP